MTKEENELYQAFKKFYEYAKDIEDKTYEVDDGDGHFDTMSESSPEWEKALKEAEEALTQATGY